MNIWLKIFLTFVVSHKVQMKKLVVNTTCLELAKPSNQQFRLACSQYDYHCLLDETFTKEFEVCREWKWIPGGQCSYFNTYGEGNIDGRPCVNSANFICPTWQYSSAENTKYTACYVKKITSTIEPRTRVLHFTSTETSDGGNSTNFPKSETNDKQVERTICALPIAFVIVISVILFAVASFYFGRLKCFQQLRKVKSDIKKDEEEHFVAKEKFEAEKDSQRTSLKESQDSGNIVRKDDPDDQKPLLRNKMDENSSTMSYVNEHDVNGARRKVKSCNEEDDVKASKDEFTYATVSLQRTPPPTAGYRQTEDKEISAESTFDSILDQRIESTNEEENGEEPEFYDALTHQDTESTVNGNYPKSF